jgi:hypothetical protein
MKGCLQTAMFDRYQRNMGIDDLVVSIYSKGISTRKMAEILEELFHNKYSMSTISRITDITVPRVYVGERDCHFLVDKRCVIVVKIIRRVYASSKYTSIRIMIAFLLNKK